MTPHAFIAKWRGVELKERSASQSHFNDLCALIGEADPISADPKGERFTFEKGAGKTSGGDGWADVWRRGCFAWEYKGKRKDLDAAFAQLLQYAIALDNPPLLIVSDMDRIRIHTNWTNTTQQIHEIALEDLADAGKRDLLKAAFAEPERLRPTVTRQALTEKAAERFAGIALRLRQRGHDAEKVAHFVNRLVFCMFAEDVGLLPNKMFQRMLEGCAANPASFEEDARTLFAAMRKGGKVGFEPVEWFNGGLFDDDESLPVTRDDVADLLAAARLDWAEVDPSILGTLFERGLDPDKRSQLGAHYTDREKIMQIVEPVVIRPLLAEWQSVKAEIVAALEKASKTSKGAATKARAEAERLHRAFLDRLAAFRVLDPACGSGNFLYIALLALKDIEHRVNLEAEALGLRREFLLGVTPANVLGIELNPYAAELARVSVWIGDIQWMRRNGFEASRNPILRPLQAIECRDAVLNADGTRAAWPKADAIVGNPPFLGGSRFINELGEPYTLALRAAWRNDVPGFSDLVCYWFAKATQEIRSESKTRVGFVATNSIRGGVNNKVLKDISDLGAIFTAWSDEEWTVEGAAVRVSLICFSGENQDVILLDGKSVEEINSDLNKNILGSDLTKSATLSQNKFRAFLGTKKGGPFDIVGGLAREMLLLPRNPNGIANSAVIFRRFTGSDIAKRPEDRWIIDFGHATPASQAMLFEQPFEYVHEHVKPIRDSNRRDFRRLNFWLHSETTPGLRLALSEIRRFIATPRVSKHRLFVWLNVRDSLDDGAVAIARDDDTTFGILHSRFHELWSLRMGTSLEDRPRYTPSTTFETFPFPAGLTPDVPAADYAEDPRAQKIAAAAASLNIVREAWLNPADLIRREPEVVAGYPDRILPKDDAAAAILKKRTLTNLYNARPAWLSNAHAALDEAVAEAYGWGEDWRAGKMDDDEILARLFQLNQERATAQG